MKKLIYVLIALFSLSFYSCEMNKANNESNITDTTSVDLTTTDSVIVDSVK